MRKIFVIICLCAVILGTIGNVNAQSNKKKTEKIISSLVEKADKIGIGEKVPGWKLIKARATGKKTLLGMSLGYGNLGLTDFSSINNYDGGTQWSIRLKIIFYQNKQFSIHTGIGYESNIFKFKDVNFTDSYNTTFYTDEKLVARYITIPLQAKYKLSKNFSAHAGLIAGLNFNTSHTGEKFLWNANNVDYTARREYTDFNPFKLDAQAGITLYHVTFYFKYGLLNTFTSDADLSAHAMSWGISLGI